MWLIYNEDNRHIVRTEETQEAADDIVERAFEFGGAIQTDDEEIIKNYRYYVANETLDGLVRSEEWVEYYRQGGIKTSLKKLRELRTKLMSRSDWVTLSDVQLDNKDEWLVYRQALRDWPNNHQQGVDLWSYVPLSPGKTREEFIIENKYN